MKNKTLAAICALLDTLSAMNRRPRAWVRKYVKFFRAQYSEYKELQ